MHMIEPEQEKDPSELIKFVKESKWKHVSVGTDMESERRVRCPPGDVGPRKAGGGEPEFKGVLAPIEVAVELENNERGGAVIRRVYDAATGRNLEVFNCQLRFSAGFAAELVLTVPLRSVHVKR